MRRGNGKQMLAVEFYGNQNVVPLTFFRANDSAV